MDLLLDDQQPPRLLEGSFDGRDIEWIEPTQIDDLGIDPTLRELVARDDRAVEHQQRRHDRDVTPSSYDLSPTDLTDRTWRYRALTAVEALVLEDDHGIVARDRSPEHRVGPSRRSRRRHSEAWEGHEPALSGRRVLSAESACATADG